MEEEWEGGGSGATGGECESRVLLCVSALSQDPNDGGVSRLSTSTIAGSSTASPRPEWRALLIRISEALIMPSTLSSDNQPSSFLTSPSRPSLISPKTWDHTSAHPIQTQPAPRRTPRASRTFVPWSSTKTTPSAPQKQPPSHHRSYKNYKPSATPQPLHSAHRKPQIRSSSSRTAQAATPPSTQRFKS